MKGSLVSDAFAIVLGECDNDKAAECILAVFRRNPQIMWKVEDDLLRNDPFLDMEQQLVGDILRNRYLQRRRNNKQHVIHMFAGLFSRYYLNGKNIGVMARTILECISVVLEDREVLIVALNSNGMNFNAGNRVWILHNPDVCGFMADQTKYVFQDMDTYTTVFKPFLVWAFPILCQHIETEILKK